VNGYRLGVRLHSTTIFWYFWFYAILLVGMVGYKVLGGLRTEIFFASVRRSIGPKAKSAPQTETGPTDQKYVCFVPELYVRSPRRITCSLY
jgi:hypothetical protein